MSMELSDYNRIIGYGVGQYYETIKTALAEKIKLDALCDKKFDEENIIEYDGIPVVSRKAFAEAENVLVILMLSNHYICAQIQSELKECGIPYVHVDKILQTKRAISGKELKQKYPDGKYEDFRGNKIFFDETLADAINVYFKGNNNVLEIGRNVTVGSLDVAYGCNGWCKIGDNTDILGAQFHISEAGISIGSDCLFSIGIILRTHDAHHIFDKTTHKRLNYAKDIIIGNQVWIAYNATLHGGCEIGDGSVVGERSLTSSRFGDHVVIAGSPAKVLRENICWSKDGTEFFNCDTLEECLSQDALKYMD